MLYYIIGKYKLHVYYFDKNNYFFYFGCGVVVTLELWEF